MFDIIKALLSEGSGVSTTRVITFMSFFAGVAIAFFGLYHDKSPEGLAMLVSAFIGPAIAGKVVQKFAEVKKGAE